MADRPRPGVRRESGRQTAGSSQSLSEGPVTGPEERTPWIFSGSPAGKLEDSGRLAPADRSKAGVDRIEASLVFLHPGPRKSFPPFLEAGHASDRRRRAIETFETGPAGGAGSAPPRRFSGGGAGAAPALS